jgi:cobalt-zinc-cadmium efflux system protein
MNTPQEFDPNTMHRRHDDHDHDHAHGNPFIIPFTLILLFTFVEFYTGVHAKSLALLGDAWHMFSDVIALGLAMLAAHSASKAHRHDGQHTRFELIASLINVALMLLVIAWIVFEAIERFKAPQPVAGVSVMWVAFVGLLINLFVAVRLHHHDGDKNLNQHAAFVHVIGDLLGSVAALISGIVIYFTGWFPIDPILSIVISLLLLAVTINLIKDILAVCKGQQSRSHHHHHH